MLKNNINHQSKIKNHQSKIYPPPPMRKLIFTLFADAFAQQR